MKNFHACRIVCVCVCVCVCVILVCVWKLSMAEKFRADKNKANFNRKNCLNMQSFRGENQLQCVCVCVGASIQRHGECFTDILFVTVQNTAQVRLQEIQRMNGRRTQQQQTKIARERNVSFQCVLFERETYIMDNENKKRVCAARVMCVRRIE